MLAMHMADTLLNPGVALAMLVVTAAVLAWAASKKGDSPVFSERPEGHPAQTRTDPLSVVPLMGVLGAFVFAAQMINFPLPLVPGTSGHLGGGLLLALLLGPNAAVLVMASILIVQCLIFQDGGLMALGANIFNMGVIPCYVGYGLFRLIAGPSPRPWRAYLAVFGAALVAVTAGAAMVPLEVRWSGLLAVPFSEFLLMMVGLHLLIAVVEAFITFGVVGYMATVRPEAVETFAGLAKGAGRLSGKAVAASLLAVALLLAGAVSLYASKYHDALESLTSSDSGSKTPMVLPNSNDVVQKVDAWHGRHVPLPDYQGIRGWSSAGGVIGTLITLAIVWLIAKSLRPSTREPHNHGPG